MIIQVLSKDYSNRKMLSGMHNLRWDVFVNRLKWKDGLTDVNFMEIDSYDNENAIYLVGVSPAGEVTASARLIQTSKPYMIKDHYATFIFNQDCPVDDNIYEITRFCFSTGIGKEEKPAAYLAAACIEYGLAYGIKNYIALTNISVKKMIERVGWDPVPLGDPQVTPDNIQSIVCKYSVNEEMLRHIKQKNGIDGDTAYDPKNSPVSLMDLFRDSENNVSVNAIPLIYQNGAMNQHVAQ